MVTINRRVRLEIGEPRRATIILVGCGGTGSFVALHLARLAYTAREQGYALRLLLVDFDAVEAKNIGRQNFAPAEIGQPKAMALARRYSLAFGLEVEAYVGRYDEQVIYAPQHLNGLDLVIGAVDTPATRREIEQGARKYKSWWLDAGNDHHSGQVLIGNGDSAEPCFNKLGMCVGLPYPSVQEPGIVKDEAGTSDEKPLSCAELTARNVQSLMINQAMAGWLAVYAQRLLLGHDLDIMATYVDLAGGNTRSVAICAPTI
jgi:PRTRC genetic system ThiF family protein